MKVTEIAHLADGRLDGDGEREISGISALETATGQDISFADAEPALKSAADTQAGCIFVPEGVTVAGHTTIAVKHPRLAIIRVAEELIPPRTMPQGIHPTAVVASDVVLGAGVSVGPHVVIESGVSIGPETSLGAGSYLGEGVKLGSHCVLHPRVTIYPGVQVGNGVILHSGVVLGADGFGYVFAEGRHHKFPQLGGLIIDDDVEVGANTTIDRGSLGTTRIGEGSKIDNLVQVAHNVRIGCHVILAAQVGISGSTEVGDYVVMGGQVGIGDHVRIEDGCVIGGQAGILPGKVVHKGSVVWGTPARPLDEFKKLSAHFSRLPALAQKVKELSQKSSSGKE